jgi:surfactin synthase thioesterase subunit
MGSSNGFSNEWIRRFHPSDCSDTQLVCFPHAGGSASYYFPLSAALAPHIETLAVQYPGRQDRRRERCIDRIPQLADRIAEVLPHVIDGRTHAFFGHSMGAILAFEVARRLASNAGSGPAWIFASAHPAPSRIRGGSVHRRSDEGIVAELRSTGGTDLRWLADPDLVAAVLPAVRADYKAIETHPPGWGSVAAPITVLVGDTDPQTTLDEATAWRDHTSGAFTLRVFSGGHFYLDEHRSAVLAEVSTTLGRIRGVVRQNGRM